MPALRVTVAKWNGDDQYSFAVFLDGKVIPDLTGLNQNQARHYQRMVRSDIAEGRRK